MLMPWLHKSYAQKDIKKLTDSLLLVLSATKEDTAKVNLLAEIMFAHVYYKPEEGLAYQKIGLELAQKTNWKPGIAKIKHRAGRLYWRLGNFTAALTAHIEALELYKQSGNKHAEGRVLIEIGQDYLDDGKLNQANAALLKALKYNQAMNDTIHIATTYDVLCYLYDVQGNTAEATKTAYNYLKISERMGDKGTIAHAAHMLASTYQALGNNTDALKYFKKGLQVSFESGKKIELINLNISIGEIYLKENNFDETQQYFNTALVLANEINDAPILAYLHRSIGNFYLAQGKYTNALNSYLTAEAGYISISNKQGLASLYSAIGNVYTSLNKYNLAKQSFDKAKMLYDDLNSQQAMGEYYSGKERLDSVTGNWKSAYKHYKQYITIRDSSSNKSSLQKLVGSQLQFENEKKEAILKAEQEKKDLVVQEEIKRQRNIRNSAFVILAAMLIFTIVAYRQRNKLAREKNKSDQLLLDKELLLREIHHRVKNNLEIVSSLLALQSAQIDDPNTKEAMLAGQNRVHSIGIVHQKLYQGTNLGGIEMKDYFINLSESILDSFGAEKRVTIECTMEQLDVDIDTAVPLGLIVNELLTNTLKYAFPQGQAGKVQIKLHKQKDGMLQLEVSDNGVGKSGITHGTGFGGQLVALLTQQLGGTMREEISNGTRIYFEFKNTKAA